MNKITLVILLQFLSPSIFAQSESVVNQTTLNKKTDPSFDTRKKRGFYNIMQASLLFGNNQNAQRSYNNGSYHPYGLGTLDVAPSFTITNGYMTNENWAIGAGVGLEIFNHNLIPSFAELRYTLWDHKISPFFVIKCGYSFGNFRAKHYDELYLNWPPYNINDSKLRHYGGLMVHPELGVKLPLNEDSDLLFTAAYRHQKTKSIARKEYGNGQFDEWEHNEAINRLSFGVAIMFR